MANQSGTTVMAGTQKGAFFFHSDASRKEWKMTGPHLPGWEVSAVHRDAGGRIYLGTTHYVYGATFRCSDDNGQTWREMKAKPEYAPEKDRKIKRIWQVISSPHEKDTLFCGVDEAGLFISRDRGETWSEVDGLTSRENVKEWMAGGGGLCLHTILIDPKSKDRMWVAISAVGAFRTDDGGKTWKHCNQGLPGMPTGVEGTPSCYCVHKVVLDPKDPSKMYMQFHGGVLKSDDAGDSWSKIEEGLPGNFGFPMVVTKKGELFIAPLQADEQRYFKDGKFRIYRSNNNGQRWEALSNGLPGGPQFVGVLRDAMAVDGSDPAGVYVGTTMGEIWYSADAGNAWAQIPGQLPRIEMIRAYNA